MKKVNKKGFTLVELLVVIAIIGLLTGMVVVSIQNSRAKARDAQRVSDINSIATALALYHNDFNIYPIYDVYITGADDFSIELENAGAISGVPTDPMDQNSSDCGSLAGYHYYYQSADDGSAYYLGYCLETNSISGKSSGENYVIP